MAPHHTRQKNNGSNKIARVHNSACELLHMHLSLPETHWVTVSLLINLNKFSFIIHWAWILLLGLTNSLQTWLKFLRYTYKLLSKSSFWKTTQRKWVRGNFKGWRQTAKCAYKVFSKVFKSSIRVFKNQDSGSWKNIK